MLRRFDLAGRRDGGIAGGIVVPGLRGSEPEHWQSAWQQRLPWLSRISVGDWNVADLSRWRDGLHRELDDAAGPVVLIGHSFGSLASAVVAAERPEDVAALLLVAPADPDKFSLRPALPKSSLRMPTVVVGSLNDPWMPEHKARQLAQQLGADYQLAGAVGHINVSAGVGAWLEGLDYLWPLLAKARQFRDYAAGYGGASLKSRDELNFHTDLRGRQ